MESTLLKSLILLLLGGGLLLLAVLRLRRYRLKERYTLVFVLVSLPLVALAVWPDAVGVVARVLHMDYRTVTLLCVAGVLGLMVFELLTIVSVQDQKITALAQLVAILMEKQRLAEPEHTPGQGEDAPRREAA